MSGQLRKRLGPKRRLLTDQLEPEFEIRNNFESDQDRNDYLQSLLRRRQDLKTVLEKFQEIFDKLFDDSFDDVDEIIEMDSELIGKAEIMLGRMDLAERQITIQQTASELDRRSVINQQGVVVDDIAVNGGNNPVEGTSRLRSFTQSSIRLPKLQLVKFCGDVKTWGEFWDSFDSSIHSNTSLSQIDKMNYLRSVLSGEAKASISGLSSTADNYSAAIQLLKNRYGKRQLIIDSHYSDIINLKPVPNHTPQLRALFDNLEQHFLSLESLGECVEHRTYISIIKQKLPSSVILHITEKLDGQDLTVNLLRNSLRRLIEAREEAEASSKLGNSQRESASKEGGRHSVRTPGQSYHPRSTAGTLVTSDQGHSKNSFSRKCFYCSGPHFSDSCSKFPTVRDRRQQLADNCLGCLGQGHRIADCTKVKACPYCKRERSHHRSLCIDRFLKPRTSRNGSVNMATEEHVDIPIESQTNLITATSHVENSLVAHGEEVFLQTAFVKVSSDHENRQDSARLLLDCGSQRSYISKSLASKLNLRPIRQGFLSVFTFGSDQPHKIKTEVVEFKIALLDGSFIKITANVVPTITGGIYRSPVRSLTSNPLFKSLPLADHPSSKCEHVPVEILIGNDYYLDLVTEDRIPISKGLYLLGSKLGWIVSGRQKMGNSSPKSTSSFFVQCTFEPDHTTSLAITDSQLQSNFDLKNLWDLETVGIRDNPKETGDDEALASFNNSIELRNNRYFVQWPWKAKTFDLPSNYELSLGRLKSIIRRYQDQPEIFGKYQCVIDEQIRSGIVELVDSKMTGSELVHYIPHHAVLTPDKESTKIRIVFDGSAKSKRGNLSLNECLHRGPVFLDTVAELLMRFRLSKFAILADIEKAFLQVGLLETNRDVVRFVWLRDPKKPFTNDNIAIYRFCRVPFGIISSPFLLSATLKYHLQHSSSPIASKLLDSIYVDNVVTGVDRLEDALLFHAESKKLFDSISMNLRDWVSNSNEFNNSLPPEDRYSCSNSKLKVLGVNWDRERDQCSITIPMFDSTITKRGILRFISSIYDPLGLISPVVLPTKLFLQKLWKANVDWDSPLSEAHTNEWSNILEGISSVPQFEFPRFLSAMELGSKSIELHCFSDASMKAYGACVYLRVVATEWVSTYLLFAKSRTAPIDPITLPRLELIAAQLGSQMLLFVEQALRISISQKFLWTDSKIVLWWLQSLKPLSVFVRNRISKIRSVNNVQYRHVAGTENPADIASRGLCSSDLIENKLWWNGPTWLSQDDSSWPTCDIAQDREIDEEIVDAQTFVVPEAPQSDSCHASPFNIELKSFSSLIRLFRVTAWAHRFVDKVRGIQVSTKSLSTEEIDRSKFLWIKHVQQSEFADIISTIKTNSRNDLKDQLGLWLDQKGLIRCGGRLVNSDLSELGKHPILLPKSNHLTNLIIESTHRSLFHAGTSHTLARIREEFWIPAGRSRVYQSIRLCTVCRHFDGGPYKAPTFPVLPRSRVSPSSPFTHTGIDYLGPLYVKKFESTPQTSKCWICLFTCLSTRSIHLEVVSNLSAVEFLLAFRRFIARRGKPSTILSDNATHFKLSSQIVGKTSNPALRSDNIADFCSRERISWNFITEGAPWMGGTYERLVKLVKQALRKSLGSVCLTAIQLQTVITEIEAVLNSRPLSYIGSDFESGHVITPSHFLSLNPKTIAPDWKDVRSDQGTLTYLWKRGQSLLNHFWNRWRDMYLKCLRERKGNTLRQSRTMSHNLPRVGDVVHVKTPTSRGQWPIAIIRELPASADGMVRSALIAFPNGKSTRRAIAHLYPLEINSDNTVPDGNDSEDEIKF